MTLTQPLFSVVIASGFAISTMRSHSVVRIRQVFKACRDGFGMRKWSGNGMGEPRHAIIFAMHLLHVHLLVDT
jgi:hypothetical protein